MEGMEGRDRRGKVRMGRNKGREMGERGRGEKGREAERRGERNEKDGRKVGG